MHVGEAVVHHISKEDDYVWTFALGDAPRLAQIHIDEDPGYGPEERAALQVRPLIENLWIGDEEDVSRRFSISLMPSLSEGHGREKDAMRTDPGFGHRQRTPAARKVPISSHNTIAIQVVLMVLSEYLGSHISESESAAGKQLLMKARAGVYKSCGVQ